MSGEEGPRALDIQFARFLQRLSGNQEPKLELAALLVSQTQNEGNICLPLQEIGGKALPGKPLGFERAPAAKTWAAALLGTGMVGPPGDFKPLILDRENRLYLRRYWEYEQSVSDSLQARIQMPVRQFDGPKLQEGLDRIFPEEESINWQREAARSALTRNFSLITGGPGTGKTTTIVGILALLLEQGIKPRRVGLAAPSGKAAARLNESIRAAKETLACSDSVKNSLPGEASTIHRLLGAIPDSPYFRHNAERPLDLDVVVIDEASMVDLATMAKLLQALPVQSRLILVGDKNQLASVESGFVFGDICHPQLGETRSARVQLSFAFAPAEPRPAIADAILQLKTNYRFPIESGIYRLVRALEDGDAETVLAILRCGDSGIKWRELPSPASLPRLLRDRITGGYSEFLSATGPAEALERFSDFRILSALRMGPHGVEELNRLTEQRISEIETGPEESRWYRGRPIMVTRNDYNLQLFNGDIGITWPDAERENTSRVFFPQRDGRLRRVLPSSLPTHETAYAMTVHKSQGSEFRRVLLILPETETPVLSRELIYTGVTRAREEVEIWASETTIRRGIERPVTRSSGLRDALWKGNR